MERLLPSPTVGFFGRQTRVVVPSLVQELVRPVRRTVPGEDRDRVEHPTERAVRPRAAGFVQIGSPIAIVRWIHPESLAFRMWCGPHAALLHPKPLRPEEAGAPCGSVTPAARAAIPPSHARRDLSGGEWRRLSLPAPCAPPARPPIRSAGLCTNGKLLLTVQRTGEMTANR